MSGFLLDTNIPSETLRLTPNAKVSAWLKSQRDDMQFVSVVTVGELRRGRRCFRKVALAVDAEEMKPLMDLPSKPCDIRRRLRLYRGSIPRLPVIPRDRFRPGPARVRRTNRGMYKKYGRVHGRHSLRRKSGTPRWDLPNLSGIASSPPARRRTFLAQRNQSRARIQPMCPRYRGACPARRVDE